MSRARSHGGGVRPQRPLRLEGRAEAHKRYLGAAANVQNLFASHPDCSVEVLLAEDDAESDLLVGGIDDDDIRGAIGVIRGLEQLAQGRLLADALEATGERYASEVTAVYRMIRDDRFDSSETVSDIERAAARGRLDRDE